MTAGIRLSQFLFRLDKLKVQPHFEFPVVAKTPAIKPVGRVGGDGPASAGRVCPRDPERHSFRSVPAKAQTPLPESNTTRTNTRSRQPVACPACSSQSFSELFAGSDRVFRKTSSRFVALQCADCGLIRLDPCPSEADLRRLHPDCHAWESVPAYQGRYADLMRQIALRGEIRFVESCLRARGPVLELAAAGGSIAEALGKRGVPVVAGDASSGRVLASLVRNDGIPAVRFRLPDSCFVAGSFSAIAAFHVLEHSRKPNEALLALRDLLAEGGRLILKIPNADCWQALLLADVWNGFDMPRHPFGFGIAEIESLLEHCGYSMLRCKHFSLIPDSTGLATSLCPWLDPSLRRIRSDRESTLVAAWKDVLYMALTAAALPLTLLEAASGGGASLLIEACRAGEERSGIPQEPIR